MLTLADLSQAIDAYKDARVSFDEFADWYRRSSRSKFAASAPVLEAALKIDAALAQLDYEAEFSEQQLIAELVNAVCLSVPCADEILHGERIAPRAEEALRPEPTGTSINDPQPITFGVRRARTEPPLWTVAPLALGPSESQSLFG